MTGLTQPPPASQAPLVRQRDRVGPDCPYVGLVPFGESDAPYFFGRRRDCEIVVANLTTSRLTLLYAGSGVGKSSVLRAGVLPRLQEIARESYDALDVPDAAVVGRLAMVPEGTASAGLSHGREDIEAPFLQLVLIRLWEQERARGFSVLRRHTLDELGGAQKIVQTHLHTVMYELLPEQKAVAAKVFQYLVTPTGAKKRTDG